MDCHFTFSKSSGEMEIAPADIVCVSFGCSRISSEYRSSVDMAILKINISQFMEHSSDTNRTRGTGSWGRASFIGSGHAMTGLASGLTISAETQLVWMASAHLAHLHVPLDKSWVYGSGVQLWCPILHIDKGHTRTLYRRTT